MQKNKVLIASPVERDFERRLRITAAKQGISKAELIRRATEAYLKAFEQPPAPQDQPART